MPSVETNSQAFNTLIRVRTLCLLAMMLLLYLVEGKKDSAAIVTAWDLLFIATVLSLVFGVLGRIKRLTGILMPVVYAVDSLMIGFWISISGGPVSFYIPFFLLILVSAIMLLPPRKAMVVILMVFVSLIAAFYLDFKWHLGRAFDAGEINLFFSIIEKEQAPQRLLVYKQQAERWLFIFLMMTGLGVLLMRQVWEREEKIRLREKALEQKRHLIQMGELTGRIAHGVNTPLGLISGNLELLLAETRKDNKIRKQLEKIEQYVQRAIATVRDVLDFSRQSLSEVKPVSLSRILRAAVAAVQPRLKKSGGRLILDVDADLPLLQGYPEGIFQVILNLLENAVDSIPPGGLITISAHFQYQQVRLSAQDRRGEIKIEVRDTGKGIPSGELKRIFEPFYSTKGFGRGTGLGLAIVKRVVEEHEGEIKVESRLGEGTTFIMLFPTELKKTEIAVELEN